MLYYDRNGVSEGIDSTKSNRNKESIIYHFRFYTHAFKFQYFNISINFNILRLNKTYYYCHCQKIIFCYIIQNISKNEAINSLLDDRGCA